MPKTISIFHSLSDIHENILKQSADDLGQAGLDPQYGWGRVNAARAVQMAQTTDCVSIIDLMPPTVSITSPLNGATVSGAPSVRISVSDNVGVSAVSLTVDNQPVDVDTTYPYSIIWWTVGSQGVPNGFHTLKAIAVDSSGNVGTSQITVNVNNNVTSDTTPPAISITSPSAIDWLMVYF